MGLRQLVSPGRESAKVVTRVPASWDCAKAGPRQHRRPPARPVDYSYLRRSRLWQPVVAVFRDLLKTSAVAVAARSRPVERPAMASVNRPPAAARRPEQ